MNLSKANIIVTKHARQRLKERFTGKFRQYVNDDRMMTNLIIGQVTTGAVLHEWKRVPFYVNWLASKYGTDIEIIRKSGVYYLCQHVKDSNKLVVMTAVPTVLNYPRENSIAVPTKGGARYYGISEYVSRLHTEALKEDRKRKKVLTS